MWLFMVQWLVEVKGTERAVPMRHLPLYVPAFVDKGTALFNLFGGSWADDIIQPDVPVSPIAGVTGIDNLALDTTKDEDHIPALDRPGLGHLLRDPHHSFFPQDVVPCLYHLWVFAGLQVLVVLASGNQVPLSRIAPGHILDNAKVCQVVVGVRRPFQIRDMPVPVLGQYSQLKIVLNGPGLAFKTIGQYLYSFFFAQSLGTGFLSCTLDLPRQRGVVIIVQDD